jgi:DnaJ-class molecular chaperone
MPRKCTMTIEVERGRRSVEYEVEFTVSPGEPERGPTYDCAGTPASPPEVEERSVYYVRSGPCPGCKGSGLVEREHLDGVKTPRVCPLCHGTKRITVREERPEMEDLVDDEELIAHAGAEDEPPDRDR